MKVKVSFLLFLLVFGISFSQSTAELSEIKRIDKYSEKIDSDKNVKKYKFDVKAKDKTIHYSYQKKGNTIVKLSREWQEKNGDLMYTFSDKFLLENGKKVFAYQTESWKANDESEYGWYCRFYIKNNKVFYMPSMGHGKTEDDTWDYEKELKENFNYMLKKVQEKEKIIKKK